MAEQWQEVAASDVRAGDRLRVRGVEMTVARVEDSFLEREGFVAFVEDSEARWLKVPSPADATVEVARS